MMEPDHSSKSSSPPPSSSSSWLMRTRFSRAVCYRTDSVVTPLPLPLPTDSVVTPLPLPLPSSGKKHADTSTSIAPVSTRNAQPGFNRACVFQQPGSKTHDTRPAAVVRWNDSCDQNSNCDFTFPSPLSSSTISRFSDSSMNSKSTEAASLSDYCFSPARDEELGSECSSRATSPNSSFFSMRSMMAFFSPSHSSAHLSDRSSTSMESFSDRQLPGSFGNNRHSSSEDCREAEGGRSDVRRVPSWSQYIESSGGERAVLSAEKWMVDLSQLLLGQRFASGNNSRLYHGVYKDSPVAVKVIRQPDEDGLLADRLEQIFTREVTALSCLQHRNVINFVAACKKPPVLCVITEYLSGGSLRSFLHKREGRPLPMKQAVSMALDVAYAMEYLHMKGVIHRDLKSENLVLSEDLCVKVVDFGVSCFESKCDYRADDPGTYRWMAPEMLSHKPYTRKVDVYSFGIVLWELLTSRLPYEEMGAVQAAFSVLHKNARPATPPNCPPALEQLMRRCWSTEPEKRPEFWEILRTLTKFEESLDSSNGPFQISPERNRFLPGWLQCE